MKLIPTSCGKLWIGNALDAYNLGSSRFHIVWNLAVELAHLIELELPKTETVLFARIEDYSPPSDIEIFKEQLRTVVASLKNGGKVFVHCLGGCGRTGTALACILVSLEGITEEEALKRTKEYCGGPELTSQMNFVRGDLWR